ncbi:helix-turn-helix domain-containing protein [Streptomyces sp. H27-D2]|uniref:helix-turn-helix domain-containing protein n=1 Tax=Streptomyces sp. H27-D2 TaxID=3046304 RepID=UPI002DBD0AD2|nr:helix-turn-helix transcriptional regulator [Streptomyces sp. H27-D2]MEC4015238.1 helix-turn-helix transcriptional regulator [Streptomyces sp. H27-D2]
MDIGQLPRVGVLLREWRRQRRLSQLALALAADTSARHLSCVETGRSRPSRTMVLRLADQLDVPLRERNHLLLAAGYAPAYRESALDGAGMAAARSALDLLLAGHEPYPAVVVDRWWNVVTGNRAMSVLLDGVPPELLEPPANVVRLALHPDGLGSRCTNFGEVRGHFLERLLRQVNATGDAKLRALYEEVRAYEPPPGAVDAPAREPGSAEVLVPLRFGTPHGEVSMFSTIATFGAPADVTLSELAIELFFPADENTARILRERAERAAL